MNTAPIIYALGWSLIHSLWQGAILCAFAYVLISLFQFSARLKTDLLFVLLIGLLLAFVGTFWYYLPVTVPKSKGLNDLFSLAIVGQLKSGILPASPVALEQYFPSVTLVYVLGLVLQLILLAYGYIRVQQIKHGEKKALPEAWQMSSIRLLKEMSITKKVSCYLSSQVQGPVVIGFFKPVILFPLAALSALDLAQVETILIHEINHIRRNDYLLNIVKSLIETVLFFNPFVWILGRMLERERENACDDQVLQLTGNPLVYARALLALESVRAKPLPSFALSAIHHKQYLLDRIKRMTVMKTANLHARHKLAAMTLLLAGAAGLAWTSPQVDRIPKPPVPPTLAIEVPVSPVPKMDTLPVAPKTPLAPIEPAVPDRPVAPIPPIEPKKAKISDSLSVLNGAELSEIAIELSKESLKLNDYFNSPEWQNYQREIAENAAKMSVQAEALANDNHFRVRMDSLKKRLVIQQEQLQKKLNSPEFKAKQAALLKKSEELAKQAQRYAEKFNSPEFRAKLKERYQF